MGLCSRARRCSYINVRYQFGLTIWSYYLGLSWLISPYWKLYTFEDGSISMSVNPGPWLLGRRVTVDILDKIRQACSGRDIQVEHTAHTILKVQSVYICFGLWRWFYMSFLKLCLQMNLPLAPQLGMSGSGFSFGFGSWLLAFGFLIYHFKTNSSWLEAKSK